MFRYDSITVSSAWKLAPVPMRYSQGDRVNTSLSRLMYCTHELSYIVFVVVPFLCGVYGYFPWHGHVLPGTQVVKIITANYAN